MAERDIRYQGAIIRDDRILLIKHREHESGRSYWLFPGGGIESGEKEEDCVIREMKEETDLEVRVVSLIMEEPDHPDGLYRLLKTYLCESDKGEASPGFEPEAEAASWYGITEVKWFDLSDETGWDTELITDPKTYAHLQRVRNKLGYLP